MHIIFTLFSISLLHHFAGKTWPQSTRALSFLLGSSPRRWSHTLAGGRWRCRNTLACLGDARSRCWWSSMCLSVCGCGPKMLYTKPVVKADYVSCSALPSPLWLKALFLISRHLLHSHGFKSSKPVSVVELLTVLSVRTWRDITSNQVPISQPQKLE